MSGAAPDSDRTLLERLLESGPQLPADDWSLGETALEFVLGEVARGRNRVVELGSGRSTVLIARLLRERGGGEVRALEHDPAFAATTRKLIEAEGLGDHARVIEAPLASEPLAPEGCRWYDREGLAALDDAAVELLLVDGPPAPAELGLGRSRYPALPLLAGRLAPGAAVILDDAGRAGEAWVLERWQRELGIRFERRGAFAVATSRSAG